MTMAPRRPTSPTPRHSRTANHTEGKGTARSTDQQRRGASNSAPGRAARNRVNVNRENPVARPGATFQRRAATRAFEALTFLHSRGIAVPILWVGAGMVGVVLYLESIGEIK